MQPRRIARELALLSASQMPSNAAKRSQQELQSFILAAVRTLVSEVKEALEASSLELRRSSERLDKSKLFSADIQSTQAMLTDSIELAQTAINRLGIAVDLPEFIQIANQPAVQEHALAIVEVLNARSQEIDKILEASLVDWQLPRVAQVDRNILKIAVAEIQFLDMPERVAINEAVELAKRYSTEDGHKFVNGVLRRVSRQLAGLPQAESLEQR